ncbi:MAG: ABC transporter ATP-binding protein [candidate division Zixibacteria bacterium]|nr:ABC transporter ATP-binding protein [candidate division Zixibacteria bacterium]
MSEPFFEDEALGKAYDHRLMRRLLGYLRPYRWSAGAAVFLLLLLAILQVAGPWVMAKAIDGPVQSHDIPGLLKWILIYAAVLAGTFAVQYVQTIMTQWIGQRAMLDLRAQVFNHVLTMDMRFFDRNPVGRLLTRITSDVNALNELFASGVVTIFGDVFTLLGIIGAMLYLNVKLALVTFAVLPLLVAATLIFKKKVRFSYREVRRLVARMNSFWQEHLTGMSIVQGFNREAATMAKHQEENAELRRTNLQSILYYAVFFPVIELIGAISLALIVWYGGGHVVAGILTFGALTAFVQYAERFYSPIRDLAEKYNILQAAMASSERVFKLLDTNPGITIPEVSVSNGAKAKDGEVVFDHVWFAYQGEDWVLKDVSFTVAPGETVALVGATGAGKTSIANLITRLYDFQQGQILVDGIDIRQWDPHALRQRVGTVSQDVFLFSGSVADNIRMGRAEMTGETVAAAAEKVGLARLGRDQEDGLARMVGERGSGLSVGEKQLVAFARVVVDDPGILILDEATSSVDHETEARIQAALELLFANRTNIVVAHRLSTIRNANRILVLHKGRVREEGTHDQLIAQRGIYYYLDRLQTPTLESESGEAMPRMVG